MGAFLDGRVTYELMAGVLADGRPGPARVPSLAEFARIWRDMPKIVYSTTWNRRTGTPRSSARSSPRRFGSSRQSRAATWHSAEPISPDLPAARPDRRVPDLRPPDRARSRQAAVPAGRRSAQSGLVETRTFGNGVVLLRYQCQDVRGSGEGERCDAGPPRPDRAVRRRGPIGLRVEPRGRDTRLGHAQDHHDADRAAGVLHRHLDRPPADPRNSGGRPTAPPSATCAIRLRPPAHTARPASLRGRLHHRRPI